MITIKSQIQYALYTLQYAEAAIKYLQMLLMCTLKRLTHESLIEMV